jgi:hypothetical protein
VIDLGQTTLVIDHPFVTVAGQTAPSPGITLIRGGIMITTHDVLIQHIRVRPGDVGESRSSHASDQGNWEPDGISTAGPSAYNIIVDHCSITWAVDENLSASGPQHQGREGTSRNVTFRHCIIAEALHDSTHHKGPHSKGSLIHDHCTNIAIIGNLYAHNHDRNPYFKADATGIIVNNLIYNPGVRAISVNYVRSEYKHQEEGPKPTRVSVVGNVLRHGPDTRRGLALVTGRGDVYLADNIAQDRQGRCVPLTAWRINILEKKPIWAENLKVLPAERVFEHVLQHAGARPRDRDRVDQRIVETVRTGQGHIIDSQEEVGGYPEMPSTTRKLTIPEDNIEAWLAELADELE